MSEQAPPCRCGCGRVVEWNDKHKEWNRYVHGHNLKDPENREHRFEHEEEDEGLEDKLERRMASRMRRFDE